MTISHILSALGLNSIPFVGWFFEAWSPATTLVVYWFENVAASLFLAWRIVMHRSRTRLTGHFKYLAPQVQERSARPATYLASFLTPSLMFSGAHGFFLGMLIFILTMNGKGGELVELNWRSIGIGCALTVVFLAVDFLVDLRGLAKKPFRWIEVKGERNMNRVVIVHLTLIFGMLATAFTGGNRGFFGVFIFLKILADLSAVLPQWNPEEAPAWLCKLMDRVPNAQKGKGLTFAEFWKKDKKDEVERREKNERPLAGIPD